jgi:hypothetical protein
VCSSSKDTSSSSSSTLPDSALLHFRLGHLSFSRMLSLHSMFPFINVDSKAVCDVCHFGKHRKLPFDRSFNKAVKPFVIIVSSQYKPVL